MPEEKESSKKQGKSENPFSPRIAILLLLPPPSPLPPSLPSCSSISCKSPVSIDLHRRPPDILLRRHCLLQPHISKAAVAITKTIGCSTGRRFGHLVCVFDRVIASVCRAEGARMTNFSRRLVLFLPSNPRFSPAAAFLHNTKHNKDVAVKLSRTSSFAIFALRHLPAVPSRFFVAATGIEALQSRRQALLHAAASFDGDIGSLLLAFTHQVPKLYVVSQRKM